MRLLGRQRSDEAGTASARAGNRDSVRRVSAVYPEGAPAQPGLGPAPHG
jgi:hypothetical protein